MIASSSTFSRTDSSTWQAGFLAILPWIERQARAAFRGLGAEAKEDAVTEVVASAMCAYQRLHERGELQRAFPSVLAKFAIAQYHQGRRVGASQRSGDVYAQGASIRSGRKLLRLESNAETEGPWRESLVENRRTSVPAQVAFRLDFPRWLNRLSPRDRQAAERLSLGYTTREVAHELRVSSGRISQLRRELADSWYAFVNASKDKAQSEDRDEIEKATVT